MIFDIIDSAFEIHWVMICSDALIGIVHQIRVFVQWQLHILKKTLNHQLPHNLEFKESLVGKNTSHNAIIPLETETPETVYWAMVNCDVF